MSDTLYGPFQRRNILRFLFYQLINFAELNDPTLVFTAFSRGCIKERESFIELYGSKLYVINNIRSDYKHYFDGSNGCFLVSDEKKQNLLQCTIA